MLKQGSAMGETASAVAPTASPLRGRLICTHCNTALLVICTHCYKTLVSFYTLENMVICTHYNTDDWYPLLQDRGGLKIKTVTLLTNW